MPQNMVVGNRYISGRGDEARHRLSPRHAQIAFQLFQETTDTGGTVSAAAFQEEYCVPLKHLEVWERNISKQFGSTATGFVAFHRVMAAMCTNVGRVKVLQALRSRTPLSSIEELRAVVAAMSDLKAGTDPSVAGAPGAPPDEPAVGGMSPPEEGREDVEEIDEVTQSVTASMEPLEAAQEDPKQQAEALLQALVDKEVGCIKIYHDKGEMLQWLRAVPPSCKMVVCFDAPTSKVKIFHDWVKFAATALPPNFAVWVPVGSRLDLLANVMGLLGREFSTKVAYVLVSVCPSSCQLTAASCSVLVHVVCCVAAARSVANSARFVWREFRCRVRTV